MNKGLEAKVVWITGAGSGIGRATALEFGRCGATVAVSGRRDERLQEVVEQLRQQGADALAVTCDVRQETDLAQAVQTVVERFGRLDIAVANAGFSVFGKVETLTAADWSRQFETNVVGAAQTARYALPELRRTRGRLGLIGSVLGLVAAPGFGAYTASKYAVRALGQTLAMELHGSGVSCTTVHPGFVASEITQVDNRGQFHPKRKDPRPSMIVWPADKAARVVVKALRQRKREVVFTGHGRLGAWFGAHAPSLVHAAMTLPRLGGKRGAKDGCDC
jgi:NAD(P)-dependent dehydrogenase (short-subunit alcohol dehydrogenase family)